ncbi:MAG: hypothetical protein HQL36_01760 [Alphaproteobacteria bacterium]|nr:hypothetical protein [Alphaproteobacteria bacterium]MBF0251297.1 hypothetical protein [Alphaproteobacteria bacterium]
MTGLRLFAYVVSAPTLSGILVLILLLNPGLLGLSNFMNIIVGAAIGFIAALPISIVVANKME